MKELRILKKSIESNLRRSRIILIYVFNVLFGIIVMFTIPFLNSYIIPIVIIWTLIYFLFFQIQKKRNIELIQRDLIGKISFENNLIFQFDKRKSIQESQIKSLTFEYEGFFGEGDIYKLLIYPKYQNYYFGTSNKIIVETESDIHINYIFIENKKDKELFIELIYNVLKKNILVMEKYRGKRSYGGKILNYNQIQEFKKQYIGN